MRSHKNSQTAYETVGINTLLVDQRDAVIAIGQDLATTVICGIGVDRDPKAAVDKCASDVIRQNGWCTAFGVPQTVMLEDVDRHQADQLAHRLGVSVVHRPNPPKLKPSLAGLARYLSELPPVELLRDKQNHCDSIQWALCHNNSPYRGLGSTPDQAWRSHYERYGVRPYSSTFEVAGPRMVRVEVTPNGSVEIAGAIYKDDRIPIVANRAHDQVWVDAVIFEDDCSSPVWVIDIGGRAFPIFRHQKTFECTHRPRWARSVTKPRSVRLGI